MNQELLFNKYQIFGVIQGQTEAVKKRVQSIAPNTLLNASEHDLVQALIEEFRLNVPVIKDADIYIAHSGEAQVDVSRDPMRMIPDPSRPFYVPGNKTVIAVPFEGDAEFFKIQPQTYSLSPPRAEIEKGRGTNFLAWYSRGSSRDPSDGTTRPSPNPAGPHPTRYMRATNRLYNRTGNICLHSLACRQCRYTRFCHEQSLFNYDLGGGFHFVLPEFTAGARQLYRYRDQRSGAFRGRSVPGGQNVSLQ
jgi:hypothetical protein